jgi:hypothetical protein
VTNVCSIEGCGKPKWIRGWCTAHYRRWTRHGSPTGGSTPSGATEAYVAIAAAHEGDDCLPWPYARSASGYGTAYVAGRQVHAARAVCEVAHGAPPPGQQWVAHRCGNGHLGCVNPRHLRWATPAENSRDRRLHGTGCILSADQVKEIRQLQGSEPQWVTALRYGVTQSNISAIVCGRSWKDIHV